MQVAEAPEMGSEAGRVTTPLADWITERTWERRVALLLRTIAAEPLQFGLDQQLYEDDDRPADIIIAELLAEADKLGL